MEDNRKCVRRPLAFFGLVELDSNRRTVFYEFSSEWKPIDDSQIVVLCFRMIMGLIVRAIISCKCKCLCVRSLWLSFVSYQKMPQGCDFKVFSTAVVYLISFRDEMYVGAPTRNVVKFYHMENNYHLGSVSSHSLLSHGYSLFISIMDLG